LNDEVEKTRKRYSADFKAKVAMEAIRGELTLAELAAKHGVHHTMIGGWKRQAMGGMASLFDGGEQASRAEAEGEIEKLHTKIGQLLVERDFLAKAKTFGLVVPAGQGRAAPSTRVSAICWLGRMNWTKSFCLCSMPGAAYVSAPPNLAGI